MNKDGLEEERQRLRSFIIAKLSEITVLEKELSEARRIITAAVCHTDQMEEFLQRGIPGPQGLSSAILETAQKVLDI